MLDKLALAQRMAREAEREWAIETKHKAKVAPVLLKSVMNIWMSWAHSALEVWHERFHLYTEHRQNQAVVVATCILEARQRMMLTCLSSWIEACDEHQKRVHSLSVVSGVMQRWQDCAIKNLIKRWRHRGHLSQVLARFGAGLQILRLYFEFVNFRQLVRAMAQFRTKYVEYATKKAAYERGSVLNQLQVKCARLALLPRANSAAWRAVQNWKAKATQAIVVDELTSVMQDIFINSLQPGEFSRGGSLGGGGGSALDSIATKAIGQAIGMQAGLARHVGDQTGIHINTMQQAITWRRQSKLLWLILRWKQRQVADREEYSMEASSPLRAQQAIDARRETRGDKPPSPIGRVVSPLGPRRRAHAPSTQLDLKTISAGSTPSWEAMGAEFAELAALDTGSRSPKAGEPPQIPLQARVSPRLSPREVPSGGPAGGRSWSKVRRKGSYVDAGEESEPSTGRDPTGCDPPSRTRMGTRRKSQAHVDLATDHGDSPLNRMPSMEEVEKWAKGEVKLP